MQLMHSAVLQKLNLLLPPFKVLLNGVCINSDTRDVSVKVLHVEITLLL